MPTFDQLLEETADCFRDWLKEPEANFATIGDVIRLYAGDLCAIAQAPDQQEAAEARLWAVYEESMGFIAGRPIVFGRRAD